MPDLTPKLGIKKPLGNETVSRAAFNENWDIIDANVVADKGGVPSIQAGLDAEKPDPGTVGRLYVATDTQIIYRDTGTAWQKVGAVKWGDIEGKPTSFTPSAHKSTHASGGSDALTPADIGAVNKAGDTMTGELTAPRFISNVSTGTAPLQVSSTTVVSNLNTDKLDGYDAGNSSGNIPISNGTVNTNLNADMTDGIHFRISDGVLQYNDGTGWKNVMTSVIKSIQRGVIESNATGDINITINAVDINKAVVITSGDGAAFGFNDSTSGNGQSRYIVLTNSTTLTIKQRYFDWDDGTWSNRKGVSLAWQVIEYV